MKKIKNINIFGTQGSGKDTQSEMLSKRRKIPLIVMGEIFRQEIRKKTKIGRTIAGLMKQGSLVSDKITLDLLKKRLSRKDVKKGFILNGFPRNKEQARMSEKIIQIDIAIELKISDKEALRRISGRRVCPRCGFTYHLYYHPPKKKNICDRCGAALITRIDDKPEMVKKRLKIYHTKTEPLLKDYARRGIYLAISGEQPIPKVFRDIVRKIKRYEK